MSGNVCSPDLRLPPSLAEAAELPISLDRKFEGASTLVPLWDSLHLTTRIPSFFNSRGRRSAGNWTMEYYTMLPSFQKLLLRPITVWSICDFYKYEPYCCLSVRKGLSWRKSCASIFTPSEVKRLPRGYHLPLTYDPSCRQPLIPD